MKPSMFLVVPIVALSLAACKKEAAPANDRAAQATTADIGMPAAPAPSAGQAFAETTAASDMFEIESSKLAAGKASSAKVKRFAERMIKAHTDSTAKLKTAAAAAYPALMVAPQLTSMQQQTLADLGAKSGGEFDAAYKQAQVNGHQMTLDALKAYATAGDVPQLKAFATEMMPIVTGHLNMAKGL